MSLRDGVMCWGREMRMVIAERCTQVVRHHSEVGQWEAVSGEPHPCLRPYVTDYQGYTERVIGFARRLEVPSPNVTLIVNFGPLFRVIGVDGRMAAAAYGSMVAGLHDSAVLVEPTGPYDCLEVKLTPLGARRFLGLPMNELTNRTVDLGDVLGSTARRLIEQLYEMSEWEDRFSLLDATIASRLAKERPSCSGVRQAWRMLSMSAGRQEINALADELGWSHKHLIARFREQVGLPPKTVARILRFTHALRLLDRDGAIGWAEIAQVCGYYDQAHLIRDFRRLAGTTPGEFLRRRLPDGGGIVGD